MKEFNNLLLAKVIKFLISLIFGDSQPCGQVAIFDLLSAMNTMSGDCSSINGASYWVVLHV